MLLLWGFKPLAQGSKHGTGGEGRLGGWMGTSAGVNGPQPPSPYCASGHWMGLGQGEGLLATSPVDIASNVNMGLLVTTHRSSSPVGYVFGCTIGAEVLM
jgi:hypothetical protein